MIPFVKAGDVCPICKRMKLVADGGVISCPHCKRAVPDSSMITFKIDKLSEKADRLSEENEKLKANSNSRLSEENELLKSANEDGSSLVAKLNSEISVITTKNEEQKARITELEEENANQKAKIAELEKKSKKKQK